MITFLIGGVLTLGMALSLSVISWWLQGRRDFQLHLLACLTGMLAALTIMLGTV